MDRCASRRNCRRSLGQAKSGRDETPRRHSVKDFALQQFELGAVLSQKNFFALRRQSQIVTEALGETPAGFGSEAFVVIADECPDAANLVEVTFDFERPAFQSGFALPEQFFVAMNVFPIGGIFCGVVAKQSQIQKIRCAREELKWRQVALVQRSGIGPDPADAVFFQKINNLWPVPAGMTKFDGESKIFGQLGEELAQGLSAVLRRERWRQLNQDDLQFGRERLDCTEESGQFGAAIAQPAGVRDFAGKLAGESKTGRRGFDPALHRLICGRAVKGRIDFHRWKVSRVEFKPVRFRQVSGVKRILPLFKGPGTGADSDFLLISEIHKVAVPINRVLG